MKSHILWPALAAAGGNGKGAGFGGTSNNPLYLLNSDHPGMIFAMAGSKGGKHSKGKGKSKSNKSKPNQKKPESFDSKLDHAQIPSRAHDTGTSMGKNPKLDTTKKTRYTESELEEFLYIKLEDTYAKAKNWLSSKGYGMKDIERAFLNRSYFHGQLDGLMNNILTNSVAFIEQKVEAKEEAFKDTCELYKTMLETLVDLVSHAVSHLQLQRTDAMWLLLVGNWGHVPSTTTISRLQIGDQNTNSTPGSSSGGEEVPSELNTASSSKKVRILERINSSSVSQLRRNVPILVASMREQVGSLVIEHHDFEDDSGEIIEDSDILGMDFLTFIDKECLNLNRWLEICPNDPRSAIIVDFMINIKNLQEKVIGQKEWAQQKVRDSAKRLRKDLLELRILKMEKVEAQSLKGEKRSHCDEQLCMLKLREAELCLESANCEASFIDEIIRTMEIKLAQIRADAEALKLGASEYESNLNEVLNKERRYKKKVSNIEKQTNNFRAQCDKEMQWVLQLQLEDSQAEKETEEFESKWRQEIQEKEHMLALLAEEARMAGMQKASSRGALVQLGLELNIQSQLKKDQHRRLENEMSRLCLSHQLSNTEGACFLESKVPYESSSRHNKCIFCLDRDVCVVLLPCTHQVLCAPCYEEICNTVDGCCPYCHTKIQQGIKVFG